MDQALEARMIDLLAKQDIHERLMLYCRGCDRGDAALIAQAFHHDAVANHGFVSFGGENVGEAIAEVTRNAKGGAHMIGNELIELHGDEASSESYVFNTSEHSRDGKPFLFMKCVRYIDWWERRDGVWGITYRIVVDSWTTVNPITERFPGAEHVPAGRYDRQDPIYRIGELARTKERPANDVLQDSFAAAGFNMVLGEAESA